jgi:GMP synthase (glutamine-hydrolysing)
MQKIIILDFGSQTTQLIGRRVRETGTFCEILPYNQFPERDPDIIGVILSGSPLSVYAEGSYHPNLDPIVGHYPVLGICYGAQLLSQTYGGLVESAGTREYGRAMLQEVDGHSPLFKGIQAPTQVWMSHGDSVTALPKGYRRIASTDSVALAAFESMEAPVWGVQFHPEGEHSLMGRQLLENFVVGICGSRREWTNASFIETTIAELKAQLGRDEVVLGLSGGVDSTVAAALLHRAIGDRLHCIFVNHGLLRKNEFEDVLKVYQDLGLNVTGVDASKRFYADLAGVTDPERKRKIIGADFIKVFDEEASRIPGVKWLAQGTIYPDRIESGRGNASGQGSTAVIKTHHNMVKMPDDIQFEGVIEPLCDLFKDEVRAVGERLGIPAELVWRQPFPGPGLGVRIIGEITEEKVRILQDADAIFRDEIAKSGLARTMSQFFAVLPDVRTVGVMGDHRTYEHLIAIRAVTTDDFMTADWARIPYDVLARISNRLCNECPHVNRVVYDITSKPPGTVEWV